MNILAKIVTGLTFIAGVIGFIYGEYIISSALFATTTYTSNMYNNRKNHQNWLTSGLVYQFDPEHSISLKSLLCSKHVGLCDMVHFVPTAMIYNTALLLLLALHRHDWL